LEIQEPPESLRDAPTTDKVKVLQTRDYYPFGLEMANWYMNDANATKFRYNGKELQDEGELGWYDYGARFYDPSLGRWHVMDALSEWHYKNSPYQYVFNNPLRYIDPFGLDTLDVINVYAPRLDNNLQNGIWQYLSELLRRIDNGGSYNPRKVRDDYWFDRWLLRNFDQNKLHELGGIFGASEAEPTLNNTVRASESFREVKTSDAEIKKEHAGNDETTSTGIKIDTLIKTFDPKKNSSNDNGYIIDIHDKKAKDGDTIYFKIFYHSNDKLDSVKSLHKSDNKTIYLK
jgi:RHS repeat-associated protein